VRRARGVGFSVVITPSQWRAQPWKNGRGTTREVLRVPDADDYDVRISVAEVTEPGPFSTFPGYVRFTMKLGGGAIALERRDETVWLHPGTLVELAGDEPIVAQLPGEPAELLNIVVKPAIPVGTGEAAARIVFSLADRVTRRFDEPTRVHAEVVWIGF
jgi:environmental stress-induced protein Ves